MRRRSSYNAIRQGLHLFYVVPSVLTLFSWANIKVLNKGKRTTKSSLWQSECKSLTFRFPNGSTCTVGVAIKAHSKSGDCCAAWVRLRKEWEARRGEWTSYNYSYLHVFSLSVIMTENLRQSPLLGLNVGLTSAVATSSPTTCQATSLIVREAAGTGWRL